MHENVHGLCLLIEWRAEFCKKVEKLTKDSFRYTEDG